MQPLELRARREALGLSQEELAERLGVKQVTVSRWESGKRAPTDPVSVQMVIGALEDAADDLIEDILAMAEDEESLTDSPDIELRLYGSDAAFADGEARLAEAGLSAAMHRACVAYAARVLREDGREVVFTCIP